MKAFYGKAAFRKPQKILDPHRPQGDLEESSYSGLFVERSPAASLGDNWQPIPADTTMDMRTYNWYQELVADCSNELVSHSGSQAEREGWAGLEGFSEYRDGVRMLPKHMRAESDPLNAGLEIPLLPVDPPHYATPAQRNAAGTQPHAAPAQHYWTDVQNYRETEIEDKDGYQGFRGPIPTPAKDVMFEERDTPWTIGKARGSVRRALDYYKKDNFSWFRGSRKCARARVRIADGDGKAVVNGRQAAEYFRHNLVFLNCALIPGELLGLGINLDVTATVNGGGLGGQSEAMGLAYARALAHFYPEKANILREHALLVVDTRQVERKKAGKKKARKGYVWVKR